MIDVTTMTPAQWRDLVLAAADAGMCLACGHDDGCQCDDAVDDAKERVTARAAALQSGTGAEEQ